MAESNKDLLRLETTTASTSSLESRLFVCKKGGGAFPLPETQTEKPAMFPVPKSQFLGKVKDFLGVMSESNKKLLQDAKDNPNNYDIEVLNGKESEYIELDLMLGVADLHTPEAVAAAESAIAGKQPVINLAESSSGSDSSDEDDDEEVETGSQSAKSESKHVEGDSSHKVSINKKPKKQSKIIELP